MKLIYVLTLILIVSSCAIHNGNITTFDNTNTTSKDFKDIAIGYSKANYLLGVGGLKQKSLIYDAKRKLNSYKLEPGQSFSNLVLDTRTTNFLLFQRREAFVYADVVQTDTAQTVNYSENFRLYNPIQQEKQLTLNEDVIYYHKNQIHKAKVIRLNSNAAKLFRVTPNGDIKLVRKHYKYIFKTKNDAYEKNHDYTVNDTVKFHLHYSNTEIRPSAGVIIGLNEKSALIRRASKLYSCIDIKELRKFDTP